MYPVPSLNPSSASRSSSDSLSDSLARVDSGLFSPSLPLLGNLVQTSDNLLPDNLVPCLILIRLCDVVFHRCLLLLLSPLYFSSVVSSNNSLVGTRVITIPAISFSIIIQVNLLNNFVLLNVIARPLSTNFTWSINTILSYSKHAYKILPDSPLHYES